MNKTKTNEPLCQWRQTFFQTRKVEQPDGRPLFRYRATDDEFTALKQTLTETLRLHPARSLVTGNLTFPNLFVFYAADWWRREYDGKWEWAAITESLGGEWRWSRDERANCVEQGLRYWRLERTATGGQRYLRAIALQGGLPLKLLSEARGGLGDVLRRTLALIKGKRVSRDDLLGWIRNLEDHLPKSYRKEAVLELLADVIETTRSLVDEAQITDSLHAIEQLDEKNPGWRGGFPLPVEADTARNLIDQLIRDASRQPKPRTFNHITLHRSLRPIDQDEWALQAEIPVPEEIDITALKTWFCIPEDEALPRQVALEAISGDTVARFPMHRLAGGDRYVFDASPKPIQGEDAAAGCRLRLMCGDGRSWRTQPRRGECLEEDQPWVFVEDEDGSRRFHHQGGGKVSVREAWIVTHSDWRLRIRDGDVEIEALIEAPDREIHRVTGDLFIHTGEDVPWRLRTGQADEKGPNYHWIGKRLWLDFLSPDRAFLGLPTLYDGERRISAHNLVWNETDGNAYGPKTATCQSAEEPQFRSRVLILPDGAEMRLEPDGSLEGRIHFDAWDLASLRVRTQDIDCREEKHPNGMTLRLEYMGSERTPPVHVELELVWPGNTTPARIQVPFPARGARLFDADGTVWAEDARLSVRRLIGTRLITSGTLTHPELRFALQRTQSGQNAPAEVVRLKPPSDGQPLEICPLDHVERIQRLLSGDEGLDDEVEVSLHANHQDLFYFHVSRYFCDFERDADAVRMPNEDRSRLRPEQMRRFPVHALRLESPADGAEILPLIETEGVLTGAWSFDATRFDPGNWLIYPGKNAEFPFRPMLWPVPGEQAPQTSLTEALSTQDPEDRRRQLDKVITALAADYAAPDWSDLERLAAHLGHLPLPTLDLWRRLAHHPAGMTALAIRMHRLPEGFLRRFVTELPFIWSVIPMAEWVQAMRRCIRQADAWGASESVCADHLTDTIERLARIEPCLNYALPIARDLALGETSPEFAMMKREGSDAHFAERLFSNENGPLQNLLRQHAEDQWPNGFEINALLDVSNAGIGFDALWLPGAFGFKTSVIKLPILLAYSCAANTLAPLLDDPRILNDIRRYQDFDLDWFAEAFNHTIARCVSRGLIVV